MYQTDYYDSETDEVIHPKFQNFLSSIFPGRPTRYEYVGGHGGYFYSGPIEWWKETDEFKEYRKLPFFSRIKVALRGKSNKELGEGEENAEDYKETEKTFVERVVVDTGVKENKDTKISEQVSSITKESQQEVK